MAESPKAHRKVSTVSHENHNESEPLEQSMTKSPKEKSKTKPKEDSLSSSEHGSPNKKVKFEREKSTPNRDSNMDESPSILEHWTFEEEQLLLEKVGEYLVVKESSEQSSKPLYLRSIEWQQIDPPGKHTIQEAKARFLVISNKVRKQRTAKEILDDMKLCHKRVPPKSKKKEVDPDLPKKPVTSYFIYLRIKRPKMQEKYPDLNNIKLTQKLSRRWKKLSEEKKKKYSDIYHQEMEQYQHEMVEYWRSHYPAVEPPMSSFDLWAAKEAKSIKGERPDISDKKLTKKLKRRWESVEGEEKSKWDLLEKKEFANFKKRITKTHKKANQENS